MVNANGFIPAAFRRPVQGDIQLELRAAYWWERARRDALAEGVHLLLAEPAGGYRPWDMQVDMRIHPSRYNLNPLNKTGLALPGQSPHGLGTAEDVASGLAWMIANGSRYGFHRPLKGDPNHFVHNGLAIPAGAKVHTQEETEDDMKTIQIHVVRKGKPMLRALLVTGTAYFVSWEDSTTRTYAIANGLASSADTGNSVAVDQELFDKFQAAAAALR